MTRRCTVCAHPERAAIDAALAADEPNRRIAAQYALSETSIRRHKEAHLPAQLAQAAQAAVVADADDLLAQVADLQQQAQRIKNAAEQAGDLKTALAGIRELCRIVELLAKLRGELDARPVVNILLSPQWIEVRTLLLTALSPYPDARQAAAQALLRLTDADRSA